MATSKKTMRAARTRELIIKAAEAAFAQDGLRGATVASIAANAGVTKPTFYAHFGGKEEVFQEIKTNAKQLIAGYEYPEFQSGQPVEEQLLKLLDNQFEPILNPARAHLYRVIMSELCLRNDSPVGRDRLQAIGLARWLRSSGVTTKSKKEVLEAAELFYGTLYGDLFFPVMLGIERTPNTRARRRRLRQAIAFLFSALKYTPES